MFPSPRFLSPLSSSFLPIPSLLYITLSSFISSFIFPLYIWWPRGRPNFVGRQRVRRGTEGGGGGAIRQMCIFFLYWLIYVSIEDEQFPVLTDESLDDEDFSILILSISWWWIFFCVDLCIFWLCITIKCLFMYFLMTKKIYIDFMCIL